MTTLTEQLSNFIVDTNYKALPSDILASTKRRILDTMGVAWAGSTAPGCGDARTVTLAEGAKGVSTLWASGEKTGSRGAAFVNGMHAAALDFDSVYEKGSVHPDIVVVPAAWAVAEQTGSDGKAFLAAVALGNEVACRLGAANRENRGWFFSSLHGVFGAAAAAGKLLKLDANGIRDALGLALTRASGTQQALIEKSLAKRAQSGFAAEAGVFAAQLAAAGVSGPSEAIEGKFGYHALYGAGEQTVIVDRLGSHYESLATAIKKYPSCTANHVPIDLLIETASEYDLKADEIENVEVEISRFADGLVGAPFDPSSNAQVAAQFSIHYSAASALLRRKLGISEIQEEAIFDERIASLIPRIDVTIDEDNNGKFAPAGVRIRIAGGKLLERRSDCVPGTPENPLSDEQVALKFRDCAAFGLHPMSTSDADQFATSLDKIDEQETIAHVFDRVHG
ncbi:MAG: MmgE/PrpD family protein [Pseudomonadota bacterium]|nr:MmgE/PrpD family protein [Pseudomonadota bacterium]